MKNTKKNTNNKKNYKKKITKNSEKTIKFLAILCSDEHLRRMWISTAETSREHSSSSSSSDV